MTTNATTTTPPRADLATLAAIMSAQSNAIPFENIDVVLGRTISMSRPDVVKKLVDSHRGGYCFEQNTLLSMALECLGFVVTPLLCRVRWGRDPIDDGEPSTTYTHLALKVDLDDGSYLADVGFAGTNSISPIRIAIGVEQNLPEGKYRIVHGTSTIYSGYFVLQLLVKDEWRPLYTWRDVRAPIVDQECSNWYMCTYPTTRFMTSLFVCRVVGETRHHILNGEYVIRTGHGIDDERKSVPIANRDALLILLGDVFGIRLGSDDIEGTLHPIDRYLPKL